MEDLLLRDVTINREVVSYNLDRGSGRLLLAGKIEDGLIHTVGVLNKYTNASGNSAATLVKIQVASEKDELIYEVKNIVRNNKMGKNMFTATKFFENQERQSETHVFGSLTEELVEFEVSKRGFQERFKRIDISLKSKKQGASLLHVHGNTVPTHDAFISLDICVSASRTIGLKVDLGPLLYSSHRCLQKMSLDYIFYDRYPPTSTTSSTSRQNRPALVGGGKQRTKAATQHSNNSGEQNLDGIVNSSGPTDGIGNNCIFIKNFRYVAPADRCSKA